MDVSNVRVPSTNCQLIKYLSSISFQLPAANDGRCAFICDAKSNAGMCAKLQNAWFAQLFNSYAKKKNTINWHFHDVNSISVHRQIVPSHKYGVIFVEFPPHTASHLISRGDEFAIIGTHTLIALYRQQMNFAFALAASPLNTFYRQFVLHTNEIEFLKLCRETTSKRRKK